MTVSEMVNEIKVDLGCDINSLGISDSSIELKIGEALRKISMYAPYVGIETYPIENSCVVLPEDTTAVVAVFTDPTVSKGQMTVADDRDLFSVSRYLYNYNDLSDPYIYLTQRTGVKTLQQYVNMKDVRYDKERHTLYISNPNSDKITIQYLRKYRNLEEIQELDVVQKIKEYALALCKIIEGNIRRKLQSAPGAIQLDGDSLVSEGSNEKREIESNLAREFQNIRFGIRC